MCFHRQLETELKRSVPPISNQGSQSLLSSDASYDFLMNRL